MRHKAYAKVNIFLKIVGTRGDYHEIMSRFILHKTLFDELYFVEKKSDKEFELVGDFGCPLYQNTIYKAYKALMKAGFGREVSKVFQTKALHVEKNIPSFAGLGGGSSDAASFLHMVNREANLNLSDDSLAVIGQSIGADVPFFVYRYDSANVLGIGEIVEKFDEKALSLEVITPDIKCDTGEVYRAFRKEYKIDINMAKKMLKMKSEELLKTYRDLELNDLLKPALKIDKNLENYRKENWFFSGSGSSFFRKAS